MNDNEKGTLGKSIRDMINPALEDSRTPKQQSDILDGIFMEMAEKLPQVLEFKFTHFFNHLARASKNDDSKRNPIIIDALTVAGQEGDGKYSPIERLPLPISTAFTRFTAEEVKDLPGYIKLHEAARDMDISIKVHGLLAEEKTGSPFSLPPMLIVDATKTYEEGAMENSGMYPNLPPKKAAFDKKAANEFRF